MTQNTQLKQRMPFNLQAITLYIYDDSFLIEANSKTTYINSNLMINRKTHQILEISKSQMIPGNCRKQSVFSAFFGILPILNKNFLFFAEQVQSVCVIQGSDIYHIKQIALVPFQTQEDFDKDDKEKTNKIYDYAMYLKGYLMKQGYYFSYNYQLTLSRTAYAQGYPSRLKYSWNSHMAKSFLRLSQRKWFVALIQGSIQSFKVFLQGKKLQYFLITRRSWKKGGTRYNARGIDHKGNVANFCETQQIIFLNNYCFSHVQIRGSVPLFWKQTGIYADVQFYGTSGETKQAFKKHFNKLQKNYDKIFCINLLSQQKSGQIDLTLYFEKLLQNLALPNVRYEFYDFHFACKGQKFERSNYLIGKLSQVNKYFKYYIEDIAQQKVIGLQQGVMRTNCLDCLDRTNLIQSKIAYDIIGLILTKCGFDLMTLFENESLVAAADNATNSHTMIVNLKNLWADNGDIISKHYTGTGSTHTNITRTGQRDLKGMMDHGLKSLGRFYKQYMEDNFKQQVIDILIGEHTETINLAQFQLRMKNIKDNQKNQILQI